MSWCQLHPRRMAAVFSCLVLGRTQLPVCVCCTLSSGPGPQAFAQPSLGMALQTGGRTGVLEYPCLVFLLLSVLVVIKAAADLRSALTGLAAWRTRGEE